MTGSDSDRPADISQQHQDAPSEVGASQSRRTVLQEFNAYLRSAGRRVWIVPALILANAAVFAAMAVQTRSVVGLDAQQLINWGANVGALTLNGEWWRLVTALFLHLNLLHLALNMWVLWSVGRLVERVYGSLVFLLLYLLAGVSASVASLIWNPNQISVGASGAIFGILGAMMVFLLRRDTSVPRALVHAQWAPTSLFIIFSLVSGAMQPGIDNSAHVGGLIAGIIFGWVLLRPLTPGEIGNFPTAKTITALALAGAMGAAGFWYFAAPGSVQSIPEQYFRTHQISAERRAANVQEWQQIGLQVAAGTLSYPEVAQRFDREIVPFWRDESARLQQESQQAPSEQRAYAILVADAAKLRLAWAQALADAFRKNDADRMQEAAKLMLQSDSAEARVARLVLRAQADHLPRPLANSDWVVRIRTFVAGAGTCIEPPPQWRTPIAATDAPTDGPATERAMRCRAQSMFLASDFRGLDELMQRQARDLDDLTDGSSSFEATTDGLDDLFHFGTLTIEQVLQKISDWRRAVPNSVEPDLVEVLVFHRWGWTARGYGTAAAVSPQALEVFAFRTEMAASGLREIADRAASNPLWYELSLSVGRDQSIGVPQLRSIFDRGRARFPHHLALYERMLTILMPRWLGSYRDVAQFIYEMATEDGKQGYETYARLFSMYSSLERDEVDVFRDVGADWEGMVWGLTMMIGHHPKSDYILNTFAKFACIAGDENEYRPVRASLGNRYSATAWSQRVTLASCDSKLPAS